MIERTKKVYGDIEFEGKSYYYDAWFQVDTEGFIEIHIINVERYLYEGTEPLLVYPKGLGDAIEEDIKEGDGNEDD